MKLVRKLTAMTMVLGMTASFAAISASAANYTQVTGTNTTFNKYLIVQKEVQVPNLSFSYTIEPGTAVAASTGKMQIISPSAATGVTGTPTIAAAATFSQADNGSKTTTVASGDRVTLDSGEAYVKKPVTINFTSVKFSEPGVYRYLVKENMPTTQGVEFDTQFAAGGVKGQRVLDVYVTDNNGALEISQYVMHYKVDEIPTGTNNGTKPDTVSATDKNLKDKSDGFVNEYITKNLEFGKEVTGNQGSKDKYFKFNLKCTNVKDTDKYTVVITGDDGSGKNATAEKEPLANSATTYTAAAMKTENNITELTGAQLKTGHDFYLKDGQYIRVLGLPKGAGYTVTEVSEDYKQTAGIAESVAKNNNIVHSDALNGTINDKDIYTGFTNTRDGIIPTGVIFTVAPFAIGILLFGSVIFFMISRRRREEY